MIGALGVANISWRFMCVWNRNLVVYRKIWLVNFLVPLFEPLLYLAAFGVGLSALIGEVPYHGEKIPYIAFIAPALLAIAIMYNAFFENSYASFVRMFYQKTFDAMMATPLSLEDIIAGEIAWGATKSVIAAAIMLVVLSFFGLARLPVRPARFCRCLWWADWLSGPPGWFLPALYQVSTCSTCLFSCL